MPNQITKNLRKKTRNNSDQIVTAATAATAPPGLPEAKKDSGRYWERDGLFEQNLWCGQQFQYLLIANGESQLTERSALDPIGPSPVFPI